MIHGKALELVDKMLKFVCRITAFLLCALLLLSAHFGMAVVAEQSDTETVAEDAAKDEAAALVESDDEAYLKICQAIRSFEGEANLSDCKRSVKDLQILMQKVLSEHPEFFYLSNHYGYATDSQNMVTRIILYYEYEGEALTEAIAEYEALFGALVALGSEEWSDLETVLFYHDYLAAHYSYDTDYEIYDAYGFLKNGEGVCQAYSLVFDGLMSYYGIPCTFAQSENLKHIWNVVFVDGGWYYLDVTWADPIVSGRTADMVDRPGSVHHSYFLLSASEDLDAHFTKKGAQYDLVLGAELTASTTPHRYSHIWKHTTAPFVEANGHFYGVEVTVNENGIASNALFVEVNFKKSGLVTRYATLPVFWYVPGESSAYRGNFSGLCTDGRYVYYSTESAVYKYDSLNGSIVAVNVDNVNPDEKKIYSLRLEAGALVAYLGASPNGPFEAVSLKNEQTMYTITWVMDGEPLPVLVAAGTMPVFPGSTFKEGENGISYQFIGWDPLVGPAYGDATYTAVYAVIKEYLPGDVNGDGEVTISDVTAILNYIARPDTAEVNLAAVDPDGNGTTTISDVTLLLNFIAGHEVELN